MGRNPLPRGVATQGNPLGVTYGIGRCHYNFKLYILAVKVVVYVQNDVEVVERLYILVYAFDGSRFVPTVYVYIGH